jgi:hypothetical protein
MRRLHDLEIDDYEHRCVHVDPDQIKEEFCRVSADLAYWNARVSAALEVFLQAKSDYDEVGARQYLVARERLILSHVPDPDVKPKDKEKVPRVTEPMIDAYVTTSDEVRAARLSMVKAEAQHARLRGVAEAVRSKRDALVSLGATLRAELEGDPMLRKLHQ